MASFSVNPVGSYSNWPQSEQSDQQKKKPPRKVEDADSEAEPQEEDEVTPKTGTVGLEVDIEV